MEEKAKLDDLATLLDEMLAETGGPLTAAEVRAADCELGIATPCARRGQSSAWLMAGLTLDAGA